MSQYTFYAPWIESFQVSWWDPEFPQLLQMVQSLPGFLDLCLRCAVQVRSSVYTEVLEAAHPLHRGPTDHKRSVGQPLSLPEVHDQLFSFAHVQRETVVLAPWCKFLYLIQLCGLIIVGNEAQNHSIISKFDNRSGAVRGHAVVCVESEYINTCLCSGRFLRIRQSCSLFRHQFPVSVWGLWKTPPRLNTKICSSFAEGHHISHCICNSQKQSTTHTKALTDDFCCATLVWSPTCANQQSRNQSNNHFWNVW